MKRSRFAGSQISERAQQAEGGPVPELCGAHGINPATYYKWWSKFGGLDVSMAARRGVKNETGA